MNKKKLTGIALAAAAAVFLFFGFTVPIGIVAEPTATLYEYEALTEDDFKVETRTLFGIMKAVPEFSMSAAEPEDAAKSEAKVPEDVAESDATGAESDTAEATDPKAGTAPATVTEYTFSGGKWTTSLSVPYVKADKIITGYDGELYQSDIIDPERVTTNLVYEDGREKEIPEEISKFPEDGIFEKVTLSVTTAYGDAQLTIDPVRAVGARLIQDGPFYETTLPSAENLTSVIDFEDGHEKETKVFTVRNPEPLREDAEVTVDTFAGEASAKITVEPVTGAIADTDPGLLFQEDMLNVTDIRLQYADGHVERAEMDEVRLEPEAYLPLVYGDTEISFDYRGGTYAFTVNASRDTEIHRAMKDYASEIESAKYLHLTDTIMVTINEYETDEYYYLLTHIVIDDPSQIHAGLSNDDYGGSRETPTSAAERLGWVVGINGSNFSYVTNTPTMADVSIKNSQVMPDSKMTANGMEICLTNSGNLFSPQQGMTVQELLAMGVTDTWCCGDTLLISNGQAVNVGIQSEQYRYPRTAIGMVRPCEYYIITAGNGGYNKGMTYDEIRDTLMSRDCGFGKCLDGGGSSSLVFEKQLLNKPAAGSERPVTDFLYFTE
jgi:exopolysaccharide biosynthesis protein